MKKYGILIVLVAILVLAVILNVKANRNKAAVPSPTPAQAISIQSSTQQMQAQNQDFFASFRENRENTRTKELEYLDAIVSMDQTDAETLADAQMQQMNIVKFMETEFTVESQLKAKGFADAAVTIHNGSVNVVLKAKELTEQQAAQVLDIVCRETGEEASNIKISTIA